MKPRVALASAFAALGMAQVAHANPVDIFGFGARGSAMASAQVATVDDATANYYNPARLISNDILLDVGYQFAAPRLQLNGQTLDVSRSEGVDVALDVPGHIAGLPIAIGVGMFLPDQYIARTRTLSPDQPRFVDYDNRPQRLFLGVNAAISLTKNLSIGGGLSYMSSTAGTVKLQGLVGYPNPAASDLALAIDVDLKTVSYAQAGLSWRAQPWLDVGLTYRGGFSLVIDQTFDIRGNVGSPGLTPIVQDGYLTLRSISQDLFQPTQYVAGFAAHFTPTFTLAFDLEYARWSAFQNPAAHITLDLNIGSLQSFVHIPPSVALPAPNLHDIIVPRVGVEWELANNAKHQWMGRAGYVYEPSVSPPQIGETNFIDNDKHTFSIGAGVKWPHLGEVFLKPVSIDAFAALTYLVPRDNDKISPVDPVGDYRSGGAVLSLGVTSRWRF